MISPDEIRNHALKWWEPLLQTMVSGETFFPKAINRIGKVQAGHITQRFEVLQREIDSLYRHSKNQTGVGYLVKTTEQNFRRTGNHELPNEIIFETIEDYISFTGKKKEWRIFILNYEEVTKCIPQLSSWVLKNALWLTDARIDWGNIIKVCLYFIDTPRPDLYLRQLPITVHTKFIEENSALIQSLLDFLIPAHIRNASLKRFAERYFLRYDEPLIRIRVLDPEPNYFGKLLDISIPLSDFRKLELPVKRVLIAENKMNFLTLPASSSTIAIWSGGGFNVSYLSNIAWLGDKSIFYWGDIDEHGFQILHQLRGYYPHTRSVMMDIGTFEHFAEFACAGARNRSERLPLLTESENEIFSRLKSLVENRLEQEKITQLYVENYLRNILADTTNIL